MKPILTFSVLLTALLLFGLPGAALAQDPTPVIPDDDVNAIAREMYCPVCENIPLDVCGTQACHQWREQIRQMLAEGMTEAQIKDSFARQYGDQVLATPPAEGFNWLVYIVPPVLIAIGAGVVVVALRNWRRVESPAEAGGPADEVDAHYVERLEEELRKRG